MKYKIKNEDTDMGILERILKIRNITDDVDKFLHPKLADYRLDPFKLNDMEKSVKRIFEAIEKKEKIMVF